MIATLEELVSIGVKMVKIDVLPTGFSALQAVSEWIHERQADVAITVYPAMSRLFERAVPRSFVLDLCRLCGAEIVYAGVPPLPGPGRTQETVAFTDAAEIHRLLKRSARWQLSVLPTITTNITPMNIRAYAQLVGNNVGMFVGAGIAAYSGTLREGAAVLMKALQSNHDNSNVFTDDELANCATAGFGNFAKYSDVSREVRDTFNSVRTM
jgi:ribulose 1,5-bisphosphate carboxylase large subunit-like protein